MVGLFGGGGGPATYSYGGNPGAYIPTGASSQDPNAQSILSQMFNAGTGNLQQYLPQIQQAGQSGINAANYAQGNLSPTLYNQGAAAATGLGNLVPGFTGLASQWLNPPQTSPIFQQAQNLTDQGAAAANAASGVQGPYAAGNINNANQQLLLSYLQLQPQMASQYANAALQAGSGEQALANQTLQNYGYTQGGAAQNAIQQLLANTGNAFSLPGSTYADIANYLGLTNNAANLAGQLGGLGFNQNQQQLSNIGGLLGGGGLGLLGVGGALNAGLGGGLGSTLGSLFGGGGGFTTEGGGISPFAIPGTDVGLSGAFPGADASAGALTDLGTLLFA